MLLAGGLGGLAHPEFGISINPIPTRGGQIMSNFFTSRPSEFLDLPTALKQQ